MNIHQRYDTRQKQWKEKDNTNSGTNLQNSLQERTPENSNLHLQSTNLEMAQTPKQDEEKQLDPKCDCQILRLKAIESTPTIDYLKTPTLDCPCGK